MRDPDVLRLFAWNLVDHWVQWSKGRSALGAARPESDGLARGEAVGVVDAVAFATIQSDSTLIGSRLRPVCRFGAERGAGRPAGCAEGINRPTNG